jgi:hypothetical protein
VSGALAPEIRKASDSSEALHHLSFVILSDARRSVAPERESKDLCTLAFQRWHQGILTVPSMIELLAVCKRRGTCCRLPYLFVILSASRRTLPLLFYAAIQNALVEERPFKAA